MSDGYTLAELRAVCGLESLGGEATSETIRATAEEVRELRAELEPLEEALLRDEALKAWRQAGYSAPAKLWESTKPASEARESAEGAEEEPEKTAEELYEEGREILQAEDQLEPYRQILRRLGYAGSTWPAELTHVALNSRNLDRPLNAAFQGASAAGKSHTVETALQFHPSDRVRDLTGSSARALAYTDFDTEHAHVVIGEASALHRDGIGASIIRSLAWGDGIRYETVEKDETGELRSRVIDKPGPTGLITTSVEALDPEIATRMLRVTITDSPDQTRAVVESIGREAAGELRAEPDLEPWRSAARWLEWEGESRVVVPYAPELLSHVPVTSVRMRRDARQVVTVVKTLAFMHQLRRDCDEHGRVVAAPEDYVTARRLLSPIMADTVDEVAEETREAVRAVARLNEQEAEFSTKKGVSYPELATELGLSRSGAWRRAKPALEAGYLADAEERPGYPARLVPRDELPAPNTVLPDPNALFEDPLPLRPPLRALNAQRSRRACRKRRARKPLSGVTHRVHPLSHRVIPLNDVAHTLRAPATTGRRRQTLSP